MEFVDSHAHLASSSVFPEIELILSRAESANIKKIINICTDQETLERGLELAKKHPGIIYNSAATTPHDVLTEGEALFPLIEFHSRKGNLAAVGETGLDYHYEHSPKETQQYFLKKYLKLALECRLPIIIHCRNAFKDLFEIIDSHYTINGSHGPGILHCFTGTPEEAQEILKRGWYLSLSGIVTFKKSEELRRVAELIPLDQLLIETDTPYLAPQSRRGKPNEPSYLPETAQMIADVKKLSIETIATCTADNARKVFNLDR